MFQEPYDEYMRRMSRAVETDLNYESLVITMEECAEVIQECSKIIRFHNSFENLEKEIGDLMCMVDLLHQYGYISMDAVIEQKAAKREKLKKFSGLKNL